MKSYSIEWGSHRLDLGNTTRIMGIVNVTPDSFSDGGLFFDCDAAVARGEKLAEDGADILDIGGESTRPFSEAVSAEEEIRRVVPVIEKLAGRISIPISIDTTKAAVAKQAIEAGASMINDISALRSDDELAGVAAKYGLPVILMHMKGTP
ncbi:MAG: dihydropteroate synthase, partial [Desulfobacterales bacterium]|nr:dihydropteroate synthase [Desulfobacterales bacterium]